MDAAAAIGLAIGCGILGFVLKGFSDSYVREKGKNAATKEDIGEITRKVESIRAELSALSAFSSQRREKQQERLLAFHDVAIELLHERFAVNFGDFPMDDGKSLFEFQKKFHENIVTLLREFQRLVLFLPRTGDLLTHADAVVKVAIASQAVFNENYGPIKITAVDESMARASGDKTAYRDAAKRADVANAKYWSEMRPHIQAFSAALSKFVDELTAFLAKPDEVRAI